VYNWPKNTDRLSQGRALYTATVANFDKLLKPPYHPKWKDINLRHGPGWTRLPVAEAEIKRVQAEAARPADIEEEFRTLGQPSQRNGAQRTKDEMQALFNEFMAWRERQGRQRLVRVVLAWGLANPKSLSAKGINDI